MTAITMSELNAPIGVFDSGIGGLSVLRDLCRALPKERFVYFADTAHAPYGEKGDVFVLERSVAITQQLRAQHGIKALVVACNTATAAAINDLRVLHDDLIIIGIEPALKPAAAHSTNKHVTVFATRGTLASQKFKQLLEQQSEYAQFTCVACDGLAEAIERHSSDLNHPEIVNRLRQYVAAVKLHHEADTVVLGCTHYPLVKPLFSVALAPHTHIIDNGAAVAKRLFKRLQTQGMLKVAASAGKTENAVVFISSAHSSQQTLKALWASIH